MTSYPHLAPAGWALALFALGAAIAWWQSAKAATCERHHRFGGWAAWTLAALCGAGGASFLLLTTATWL